MTSSGGVLARAVIDAEGLRQLAHPIRWKLWESLAYDGPGTATSLAARVGESSGSTSYHLRRLERLGLITELRNRGNARDRWWAVVPGAYKVELRSFDRSASGAQRAIEASAAQSATDRYLEFIAFRQVAAGSELRWTEAALNEQAVLPMTADELEAFSLEVEQLLARWVERTSTSNETRRVEVLLRAFPRQARVSA